MKTQELRKLQNLLQKRLRKEKLAPVPLPEDAKETIINNWGSVVKASEVIKVHGVEIYKGSSPIAYIHSGVPV